MSILVFSSGTVQDGESLVETFGSQGRDFPSGEGSQSLHKTDTNVSPVPMEVSTISRKENSSHKSSLGGSSLVVRNKEPQIRFFHVPRYAQSCSGHRCFWRWLGSSVERSKNNSGNLEDLSKELAHKCIATQSSRVSSLGVQTDFEGSLCSNKHGQCDNVCLYKQDGGNQVPSVVHSVLGNDMKIREWGIVIKAAYVPGIHNFQANVLSRRGLTSLKLTIF